MKHNDLRLIHANLYTPIGSRAVHGADMGKLRHVPDATIEIEDGIITYAGPGRDTGDTMETIDAGGRAVLPGFIDSHTHLIFGGYRPDEFGWRMRGDSYMSIMARGGGIAATTSATETETEENLACKARFYLRGMSAMGVTTVEAKSGYGLDRDTELKMLEVIRDLACDPDLGIDVDATFMGAHAMPRGYKGSNDDYISFIISEMLPVVRESGLARHCDVFCEKGVFSIDESRRLLKAAQEMGFSAKIHADEIVTTGGAELAAEIGALSADHLLHISDTGIEALAGSDTVATLLPLTAFALREPYAPARRMIDEGGAVALASDFNPGSCFSYSIPLMIALACIHMSMSVEEAVTALTVNGAAALGLADKTGTIEPGKQGDLAVLQFDSPAFLPYHTGINCVAATIKNGKIVKS